MPAYENEIVKMKFSAASILKFKFQIQLKRQDSIYLYLKWVIRNCVNLFHL